MQVRALQLQIEQLQLELSDRTSRALALDREMESLRAIVHKWEGDLAKAEVNTTDITADMARQYKAMQETMQLRVQTLEAQVTRMKGEVNAANERAAAAARDRDAAIAAKDAEIDALREKMEDMAGEFGDMLADTLRRMGERIDINAGSDRAVVSEGEHAGASLPVLRAMEEITAEARNS
jgi:chromosome segregation ATPase